MLGEHSLMSRDFRASASMEVSLDRGSRRSEVTWCRRVWQRLPDAHALLGAELRANQGARGLLEDQPKWI